MTSVFYLFIYLSFIMHNRCTRQHVRLNKHKIEQNFKIGNKLVLINQVLFTNI